MLKNILPKLDERIKMNRYQKAEAAKRAAKLAEKRAAKKAEKNSTVKFPEKLRVVVHGETDFIEFKFKREDFEDAKELKGNLYGVFAAYIAENLDKPELGMKTVKETSSEEELTNLGAAILTYTANTDMIKMIANSNFKDPVVHLVASRSNIGGKQGYAMRVFGACNFDNEPAQYQLQIMFNQMLSLGLLKKAFLNGEYHPSSVWYRIASLLLNIKTNHSSGWTYKMSEEHRMAIGDGHRGLKYKTKKLEGVEWNWINGKKEWLM